MSHVIAGDRTAAVLSVPCERTDVVVGAGSTIAQAIARPIPHGTVSAIQPTA
jgi:hypothetical protein